MEQSRRSASTGSAPVAPAATSSPTDVVAAVLEQFAAQDPRLRALLHVLVNHATEATAAATTQLRSDIDIGCLLLIQRSSGVGRCRSSRMREPLPRGSRQLGIEKSGLQRWLDRHLVEAGR